MNQRTGVVPTYTRAPGVRLLGGYQGSGYVDPRYLVVRPDGQTVMLTRLLYLVVQYADARLDAAAQAELVGREYGRTLPVEHLGRLVRTRLAPAGLVLDPGDPGSSADAAVRARPLLSIALRGPFVPVWLVRRIGGLLAPAFHPVAAVGVLTAFVVADAWLILRGLGAGAVVLTRPGDVLALFVLVLVSTLVHEFGHAAGCHYGGGRPGAIGAALYLWFPVFWTEVTDAYRLDRRGRLRTDLGGIYFNAVFIVLATAGYRVTGWAPLAAAALLNNVVIPQQLIPFVRMDGYYLLGDLTGVPNLFGLVGPTLRSLLPGRPPDPRVSALRRGTRVVVTVWVLVTVVALTTSSILLVVGVPGLFVSAARQIVGLWHLAVDLGDLPAAAVAWVSLVVLVLPFVGFGVLVARALRLVPARWGSRRTPTDPFSRQEAPVAESVTTDSIAPAGSAEAVADPSAGGADPSAGGADPPSAPPAASSEPPSSGSGSSGSGSSGNAAPPPARPVLPTADDFSEETMLRARRTPPERGLRRTLFVATGGHVDIGPSPAERRRAELVERVRRPLHACRRIVVLSRKGGAGKTTTALMLGHVLAMNRGDRVVALDANPDAGSLPYRVSREGSASITTLLHEVDRLTSYADVRAHTSQARTRLEIVASDDDPRISKAMGQHDYKRAIELLDRHFMIILLDTGTGILDDAIQGILTEADQIVVVMPPALDGARVAASTLDWLTAHGYHGLVGGSVAVINGVRGDGGLVQLDRVERHFAARCSAVVRIPWDRSLEAGGRTDPQDLRRQTLDAYLELAAAVADGFALPGRRP